MVGYRGAGHVLGAGHGQVQNARYSALFDLVKVSIEGATPTGHD